MPTDNPESADPPVCITCKEEIIADGRQRLPVAAVGVGGNVQWQHIECQALHIVGHDYGVCSCTGWQPSRAAALELWARMRADRS